MTIPNRIGVNKTQLKTKLINITNHMTEIEFDIYCAKAYITKLQSCKSRGIGFELNFTSFKNLMRAKKCYYTGITLTRGGGQEGDPNYLTIDRIDNNLPYQKGNVVACCAKANQLKSLVENSDMTMKQAFGVFKKTVDRGVK
jgi:hypothetical protein